MPSPLPTPRRTVGLAHSAAATATAATTTASATVRAAAIITLNCVRVVPV
jgi:hypothetical protein